MVMQMSEPTTATPLPSIDLPSVSKVPAIDLQIPSRQISTTCIIVSSSSSNSSSSSIASWRNTYSERWANLLAIALRRIDRLGEYLRQFIAFVAAKLRLFLHSEIFTYREAALSKESERQLQLVERKTLILDLDETLVHSCYVDPDTQSVVGCQFVPSTAQPDYVMDIQIVADLQPVTFQVYKRPHVDHFLDFVAKWYDLVIYTASMEAYASLVVDKLDAGRGILRRRFYRQHCVSSTNLISKNLHVVSRDLSKVMIIDNSPGAYRDFPQNAIPIKTYIYDPHDEELLNLLPFLDALRFTKDVRSILGRREL
ncbi:CTD nuclear envelope phosphatase 1 [Drosophila sulfurigaster albostrigata]|uniref:CTD nuclear envelope phosphatase 1 n=1 Tax=Drosophila sulfurigaster albostrigata TaxID=89887 RepID=UPI002D219760|nr:CTD nuclear envelope phosphatase 1 [Drosophila sulfurigaster albostrigata]